MKKLIFSVLLCALLAGCVQEETPIITTEEPAPTIQTTATAAPEATAIATVETTTATTTEATTAVTMYLPPAYSEKELKSRAKQAKADGTLTVILDPGHGIADPGAMHDINLGDVTEADLTLAIAKKLESELIARGYTVILTHDGITKPKTEWDDGKAVFGPSERSSFANDKDAHLFISLHCDAYPQSTDVCGTRIYYPVDTPYSTKQDKQFAKDMASMIEKAFPEDKDVALMDMHGQDCYTVLYKTRVPSLLVECGFITNKSDAEKLKNEEWQAKFATALADGIDKYFA